MTMPNLTFRKPGARFHALYRWIGHRPRATETPGSTVLEVAAVMPLFATLLLGIFEFAMILTSYSSATFAARAGARFAGLHSLTSIAPAGTSDIQNTINSVIFTPGVSSRSTTVTYSNYIGSTSGNYVGNYVNVTITLNQTFAVPGFSKTFSTQNSASRMITR